MTSSLQTEAHKNWRSLMTEKITDSREKTESSMKEKLFSFSILIWPDVGEGEDAAGDSDWKFRKRKIFTFEVTKVTERKDPLFERQIFEALKKSVLNNLIVFLAWLIKISPLARLKQERSDLSN